MTKTFKVERKGKQTWVVIRQMPHDPQYKVGSRIPGYGKVVEEQSSIYTICIECASIAHVSSDCSMWACPECSRVQAVNCG
jgi:hypothetical protein